MKKLLSFIAVLTAVCLLSCTAAFAQEVLVSEASAQEQTVLDAADIAHGEVADADSYRVYDGEELILEVEHVGSGGLQQAEGGYYTAAFPLPQSSREVYLTGLTRDNISSIERAIADSYVYGEDFELSDIDFIDAEKTREADADDNLCWAASSADILTYTGWAAQAGFSSADDLFELFIRSFENKGSHAYYGVGWFFNGVMNPAGGSALPYGYPFSGGYLSDYAFDDFTEIVEIKKNGAKGLQSLFRSLYRGCGVSLSANIYRQGEDLGGHAVTCWGFVMDSSFPEDDISRYCGVFITDSDSDELYNADRRDAQNIMSFYSLTPYQAGGYNSYSFNISERQTAVLRDAAVLRPYSEELTRETDPKATRNRITTPDLAVNTFYLNSAPLEGSVTLFPTGTGIYYYPSFINSGFVRYKGSFIVNITVTDSAGNQVFTKRSNGGEQTLMTNEYMGFGFQPITKTLGEGDYTITAQINANKSTTEAYYYNNSQSLSFRVRENYQRGDTDGDDEVSSLDVVWIQRIIAHMATSLDRYANLRGDADGSGETDILDATLIQRYLVGMPVNCDIEGLYKYN